ncbi:hypothetical protein PS662_06061 [Pseudomonas fluorescens]|uniref:Uncharacterized protein n=1 Tax=Pseudomonas fluorescens TaxID=294 RepID=A0A5E6Y383_PSEFL|nr:hypothetical protein PS662_06061 [Pseudomonas fluorescens]
MRGRAGNALQGVAQLFLHLRHGQQQTAGFVFTIDGDRASQVAFGNFFGCAQGIGDGLGDAVGEQPGEQHGQAAGDHQQRDDQIERRRILIASALVGFFDLPGVDLEQLRQGGVDLFGIGEQLGVQQLAQIVDLIVARERFHPLFKLTVLCQQLHVLIVSALFFRAIDQRLVDFLRLADLLVAQVEQVNGFLLDIRFAVHQQTVGQHPQTQRQLRELIETLDARHADGGDVFTGTANLAHLVQGKRSQNQHQAANQGESEERSRSDIHITKGHGFYRSERIERR